MSDDSFQSALSASVKFEPVDPAEIDRLRARVDELEDVSESAIAKAVAWEEEAERLRAALENFPQWPSDDYWGDQWASEALRHWFYIIRAAALKGDQ